MARIVHRLRATGERELPTVIVGETVMDELRELDDVAYVRFASVYRSFEDISEFSQEIDRLNRGKRGGKLRSKSKRKRDRSRNIIESTIRCGPNLCFYFVFAYACLHLPFPC